MCGRERKRREFRREMEVIRERENEKRARVEDIFATEKAIVCSEKR